MDAPDGVILFSVCFADCTSLSVLLAAHVCAHYVNASYVIIFSTWCLTWNMGLKWCDSGTLAVFQFTVH